MKFTNKQFDAIRWFALTVIPASATLVLTVGKIWDLPYYDNIAATITAFGLFLAAIIKVSADQYNEMVDDCNEVEVDNGTTDDEQA